MLTGDNCDAVLIAQQLNVFEGLFARTPTSITLLPGRRKLWLDQPRELPGLRELSVATRDGNERPMDRTFAARPDPSGSPGTKPTLMWDTLEGDRFDAQT